MLRPAFKFYGIIVLLLVLAGNQGFSQPKGLQIGTVNGNELNTITTAVPFLNGN